MKDSDQKATAVGGLVSTDPELTDATGRFAELPCKNHRASRLLTVKAGRNRASDADESIARM